MSPRRSAAISDPGRKRRRNEDAFVRRPPLFAVADGMGGAQAGEVASRLAAAAVQESVRSDGAPEEHVAGLIQEANLRVYTRSNEDESVSGMGTTMTVALVHDRGVTIGHVGDSRAYLIRNGKLEQLTEDHSLVGGLVRLGQLTPEEAEVHPQRSVILRAVGVEPDVEVDVLHEQLEPGDVYLTCSDGLTGMARDEVIAETLQAFPSLSVAAEMLVELANAAGGRDNVTVVLFRT